MERIEECPVCGKENKRIYYTEDVGLVEDHYFCPNCGYFREMAYSPVLEGVAIPDGISKREHNALFGEIIRRKNFKMYENDILSCL